MATMEATMAKRNDLTVKIDAEVKSLADAVASLRKMSTAHYLSEILKPIVERDFAAESARVNARIQDLPDSKPKKGGKP